MNQQTGGQNVSPINSFNGVKVFTATVAHDRELLGDKVTAWIRSNPKKTVVDTVVRQSSDKAFHCIAITLFFWEQMGDMPRVGEPTMRTAAAAR